MLAKEYEMDSKPVPLESSPHVKYIEPKVSVTWLVSSTVSVAVALIYLGMSVQTQTGQVKTLTDKVQELQSRLDNRDTRLDTLTQLYWELRANDNIQVQRIDSLTKQVDALNAKTRN